MTWPVIGNETGVDFVLIQTSLLFLCKCKQISIRTDRHMKSSEACIKTATTVSLPTEDQVTKHTSWLSPEFKCPSGFNEVLSKFSIGMI